LTAVIVEEEKKKISRNASSGSQNVPTQNFQEPPAPVPEESTLSLEGEPTHEGDERVNIIVADKTSNKTESSIHPSKKSQLVDKSASSSSTQEKKQQQRRSSSGLEKVKSVSEGNNLFMTSMTRSEIVPSKTLSTTKNITIPNTRVDTPIPPETFSYRRRSSIIPQQVQTASTFVKNKNKSLPKSTTTPPPAKTRPTRGQATKRMKYRERSDSEDEDSPVLSESEPEEEIIDSESEEDQDFKAESGSDGEKKVSAGRKRKAPEPKTKASKKAPHPLKIM